MPTRPWMAASTAVLIGVCLHPPALPSDAPRATAQPVTFRTDDGVSIAGTVFQPPRTPAPAVILLHMWTRSREDWEPLASQLAEAGLVALAIDLRGHGASGAGPVSTAGADLSNAILDVHAARRFLGARRDLASTSLGIAGASVGASLAALAAADDPAVHSIALLSPGLDYRGLRVEGAMLKYGNRPALLVASREDPYAARSARQLASGGSGLRELKWLDGAGHGTVMLSRQPDLVRLLVDWFRRTLV